MTSLRDKAERFISVCKAESSALSEYEAMRGSKGILGSPTTEAEKNLLALASQLGSERQSTDTSDICKAFIVLVDALRKADVTSLDMDPPVYCLQVQGEDYDTVQNIISRNETERQTND